MWIGGEEANETAGNGTDVTKQKAFILSPKKEFRIPASGPDR